MKVAFEVAKGLKYLHNTAHVLHGDIKSWNILVSDAFEVVKICDFGNSLPLTESLEVDMSKGDFSYVGTECWNPPEVIGMIYLVKNIINVINYDMGNFKCRRLYKAEIISRILFFNSCNHSCFNT